MGLKKQIIMYKDGVQVGVYNSCKEAADVIGAKDYNVSKCCLGKIKTISGYTFEYSGEFSNKKEERQDGVKCPYCGKFFKNYNGLAKHVLKYKAHGDDITQEQLVIDALYGGVRPTCACGCGEYTSLRMGDGGPHFNKYVMGHHNRVHNNWGHNPIAIQHSAETRRKQFASGERTLWPKGKKWTDVFTAEKIAEMMKIYKDENRNNKIREKLKGVPKSEEHAQKCRENGRSQKSIEVNRQKMKERLESGAFKISSKKEDKFVEECIVPLGVEFDRQHYIKELRHYCDVYIPSKNLIVEFQGDYWHRQSKEIH